jgi:23S rRNA pseudouridine2605 synthase
MARREDARRTGLDRALSKLGHCSRSQGFALVRAGRVKVNGRSRRDPAYPIAADDRISVDGRVLRDSARLYLVMNKPRGLVTTASDEKGRPTVYTLLDPALPWVAPVGRLDRASEGLLLFTNDSEWAAKITSPAFGIQKTYRVQVSVIAGTALMACLLAGVSDGNERLHAAQASILRSGKRNSWVEVVLDEGRNRHVRRMFAALGIEVLRLIRVAIGPLRLGDLKKGQVRALTTAEKDAIDQVLADAGRLSVGRSRITRPASSRG